MSETRRIFKIFLGSPSDLTEERKAAKSFVDDINAEVGEHFGCQVELVGWEDTLPGIGRPQEIINRDLDGCDAFVGMLWKRWGTSPGSQYTSGFEEEFERSLARALKEDRPKISLFFKNISESELTDPGEQLKQVQNFRERVFGERKLLAGTFSNLTDFQRQFRLCVMRFLTRQIEAENLASSEKNQAPLALTQTSQTADPGPATPLSVEGALFLRNFVSSAEKASDAQPLAAEEVARLRLLSIIAAVNGNDEQSLGPHDANLLFAARAKFDYGPPEISGMLESGLDHYRNETVPLWHWVLKFNGFKSGTLPFFSISGSSERRLGALKAMSFIMEPIAKEGRFGRNKILSVWFRKGAENILRLAALEYLEQCGQMSDLSYIDEEIQKNEAQTSNAAASAFIRITLRNDRLAALEALYTLQPVTVSTDLMHQIFSRDAEFNNEILLRGLNHRNTKVRTTIVKLLRGLDALPEDAAETLLDDAAAEVRYEAMQALISVGRNYSIEQAKAILVRKRPTGPRLGLSDVRQVGIEGEALLERYIEKFFDTLTVAQLANKDRIAIFDQHAYFALVRRDFRLRGDDLRKAVLNEFVERFEAILEAIGKRFEEKSELAGKTRSLSNHLRREFTQEGLEIICRKLELKDLPLVRTMLARDGLGYSVAYLNYLAKLGEWCDVPLVIAALDLPDYGPKFMALSSDFWISKCEDAARTIYALGKGRTSDLLSITMPGSMLAKLIPLISDKAFSELSDAQIFPLFQSKSEEVRKIVSLKYIRVFNRHRIKQFLETCIGSDQVYYNVVHWLDFGISVPRDRMLRAARMALDDVKP
jgi:hypothetical protein